MGDELFQYFTGDYNLGGGTKVCFEQWLLDSVIQMKHGILFFQLVSYVVQIYFPVAGIGAIHQKPRSQVSTMKGLLSQHCSILCKRLCAHIFAPRHSGAPNQKETKKSAYRTSTLK